MLQYITCRGSIVECVLFQVIGIVTRKDLARYKVHGEHLVEAEMTS